MAGKGLALVMGAGAIALALMASRAKGGQPTPPPKIPNPFACVFGDFTAATLAELLEHYKEVHPEYPIIPVNIQWV